MMAAPVVVVLLVALVCAYMLVCMLGRDLVW